MFTVMYRDEKGNESFHEGVSVERVNDFNGEGAGILVNRDKDLPIFIGDHKTKKEGDHPPEVFVMNESGKTVGRYRI